MGGGMIDYDKTSELVLRELRGGKLGKMTFETPEEFGEQVEDVEKISIRRAFVRLFFWICLRSLYKCKL